MPAPAQGVLAVECRTDDPATAAQLRTLDHAPTRAAAIAERGFLAALGAGCSAPVGALAEVAAETGAEPAVRVSGLIAAPDGSSVIRAQMTGAVGDGEALGRLLAHVLLEHGGAALLDRIARGQPPAASPRANIGARVERGSPSIRSSLGRGDGAGGSGRREKLSSAVIKAWRRTVRWRGSQEKAGLSAPARCRTIIRPRPRRGQVQGHRSPAEGVSPGVQGEAGGGGDAGADGEDE